LYEFHNERKRRAMKLTKKPVLTIGILVVAISTAAISFSASAADKYSAIFPDLKSKVAESNTVSDKAILQVGKVSVTAKDLAKYKAYKEGQSKIDDSVKVDTSDATLLKEIVVEKLEAQKAAELNVAATIEEGKAEAEKMREFLKTQPAEVQQFQKDLISAMGYTEEAYWAEVAPEQYKSLLTTKNLYSKLVELKEIPNDIQTYGPNILKYQDKIYNEAKSNGSLNILDQSLSLK
jgi:hypothetical protein